MTLIYDEYNDVWVFVEKNNYDIVLSPEFDQEEDAKLWKTRMINILSRAKNDI